jgi:hypothetical protein
MIAIASLTSPTNHAPTSRGLGRASRAMVSPFHAHRGRDVCQGLSRRSVPPAYTSVECTSTGVLPRDDHWPVRRRGAATTRLRRSRLGLKDGVTVGPAPSALSAAIDPPCPVTMVRAPVNPNPLSAIPPGPGLERPEPPAGLRVGCVDVALPVGQNAFQVSPDGTLSPLPGANALSPAMGYGLAAR